jgi:ubiquinone/menaquinone biosynthesis C-methylase UbiE
LTELANLREKALTWLYFYHRKTNLTVSWRVMVVTSGHQPGTGNSGAQPSARTIEETVIMSVRGPFHEQIYEQHEKQFALFAIGGQKETHAKTWLESETVDAWRHDRMYQSLSAVVGADPKATWLTIGDGRYGNDARYLLRQGCNAVASDISDLLLKEAKDNGYISAYRKENAEALSCRDDEFDYVLCKESYHHFPRPMLALYEMLRVAKKGVFLIEPNDGFVNTTCRTLLFGRMRRMLKTWLRRGSDRHVFEETGNYVFSISRREIEKVAVGLNYETVAFRGINDAYFIGVEHEKMSENGPLQRKVKRRIASANLLCKVGLMDYTILAAVLFKLKPSEDLIRGLAAQGFEVRHLPQNPHIPR